MEVGAYVSKTDISPGNSSEINISTHSFVSTTRRFKDEEESQLRYAKSEVDHNSVVDKNGNIIEAKLEKATEQILEKECSKYINYDSQNYNEECIEVHESIINYSINKIKSNENGRLIVPLIWNGKSSHMLAENQKLSKLILKSNLRKLKGNKEQLKLVENVIREQEELGIIERVHDPDLFFKEHPNYSFIPHMPIFKPERETTKCRIVFLSNLSESNRKNRPGLSHNQCMFSGPNLNQKLSSALMHLRFDKYLLTYDLRKAFNQLELYPNDQSKLLFFWYNNIDKNDFSLVVYKNVRLSFGLRCSPFLLMISLYYILIFLSEKDPSSLRTLKRLMYSLLYMDNGAITFESIEDLKWAYTQLPSIFGAFKFEVQQISTNLLSLQNEIDQEKTVTPERVPLFGMIWERKEDLLYNRPIQLNKDAYTKRLLLKTIATQFDIYNVNLPLLNRARIFMHSLQCDKNLSWDQEITTELQREWKNICKQVNTAPSTPLQRYVGPRHDSYKLLAYTDAFHSLYGTVIYLLHENSQNLSFLTAKNRIVNKQLKLKSIPSLEFNAITLGVETLIEIHNDLSGPQCLTPIKISE